MKIHKLKILPKFFEAVASGRKTFEIRKNDRDFKVGDYVRLQEWTVDGHYYTGAEIAGKITYLLTSDDFEGIASGYAVFAFEQRLIPLGKS